MKTDYYRLSPSQEFAVLHSDDHGVADPAPLYVMDFKMWRKLKPAGFLKFFENTGEFSLNYAHFKPAWQRFTLLYPVETQILKELYTALDGDSEAIFSNRKYSKRFFMAYVAVSQLVDELDVRQDEDLLISGKWNHGYVINDVIVV